MMTPPAPVVLGARTQKGRADIPVGQGARALAGGLAPG